MRRAFLFILTTVVTAIAILWWLHDGDLRAAIEPVVADWNADRLAADAGLDGQGVVTETPPD